tara:strand:- start:1419 stop:1835 length:417 start_codon:yes stop_codon:yes gene_type:complete
MSDYSCIFQTDESGKSSAIHKESLLQFFIDNPDSKFKVEIFKLSDHSKLMRAYYFAEVVTKCKMGLNDLGYNLNKDQTHDFIKQYSPVMVEHLEIDGHLKKRFKSITELDNKEFIQYIEDIKQFAIENLDILIKEPNE